MHPACFPRGTMIRRPVNKPRIEHEPTDEATASSLGLEDVNSKDCTAILVDWTSMALANRCLNEAASPPPGRDRVGRGCCLASGRDPLAEHIISLSGQCFPNVMHVGANLDPQSERPDVSF